MSKELERLLELSKTHKITPAEHEEQRRSFAWGNTHFENERITRELVNRVDEELKAAHATNGYPAR